MDGLFKPFSGGESLPGQTFLSNIRGVIFQVWFLRAWDFLGSVCSPGFPRKKCVKYCNLAKTGAFFGAEALFFLLKNDIIIRLKIPK